MVNDPYTGDIICRQRDDGTVHISVRPGPLRVSFGVLAGRDPQWLDIRDGLIVFRGVEDDGRPQAVVYRPAGVEAGPEGGWLLCEPVT